MDSRKRAQRTKRLGAHKGGGEVPKYVGSVPELVPLLSAS